MNYIKNKIFKTVVFGLLIASIDYIIAGQTQPEPSSSAATDPVLSEQQIAAYLQIKFANLQVVPDVDVRVIARIIRNGNYTTVKLDQIIDAVQQRAKNAGSESITREHVSDVVNNKIDDYFYIMLAYSLGIINKQAVAIHESGHTVAAAYLLHNNRIITEVSLFAPEAGGAVTQNIYRKDKWFANSSRDEQINFYKNLIIMALSGGVADQIFGLEPRTKFYVVIDWIVGRKRHENVGLQGLLHCNDIKGDIQTAMLVAENLHEYFLTDQTVDQILQECYEKAYQFVLDHKDEIKKVADVLMVKGTIFGNEIYDLLGLPMPKFDFQEDVVISTEAENLAQPVTNSVRNQMIRSKFVAVSRKKRKK